MLAVMKIAFVLLLIFSIAWTLLPWSFGLNNYAKTHGKFMAFLARTAWILLLFLHPLLIYLIYAEGVSYWTLLLLVAGHALFHKFFGRNVGAG